MGSSQWTVIAIVAVGLAGCARVPAPSYAPGKRVEKLDVKFQDEIRRLVEQKCGTPTSPKLLGNVDLNRAYLKRGAEIYEKNCLACHGVSGDGNGPAAAHLLPRPRDYRPGIFKFTSTTYGSKPLREDLIRTVQRGIAGTSMPAFRLLAERDVEAVVDYVIALSRRGEFESLLAEAAEFDAKVDPNEVPAMVNRIVGLWAAAKTNVVYPASPMPVFTPADVSAGKAVFIARECAKCHGPDGRGQTKEDLPPDVWGNPTMAADLTSGMLRGGTDPIDIYRHIDSGINGTPMPSFRGAFQKEPETVWKLVSYVLHLSNGRRRGDVPEAGVLKPLPGVEKQVSPARTADGSSANPASSTTVVLKTRGE